MWGLEPAQQLCSGRLQGRNDCAQRAETSDCCRGELFNLGVFSAAYQKMTGLSLLPYNLNST